jgi:phosphatidylinositol-3-phosphatase
MTAHALRATPLATLMVCAMCAMGAGGCGKASPGTISLATPASKSVSAPAHSNANARRSRVIVVMLENAEYGDVIGSPAAPYVNSLVRRYGLMTQSYAIGHPSLPNYLALTSGSTHGIDSDCTSCAVSATNMVDQLEAAKVSWGAYLEDVPSPCFTGAQSGGYAKKHNPFAYYGDIVDSPTRCRRLVGSGPLAHDVRSARLPTFVWISPNLCDDGHDCGVSAADRFLARNAPALLRSLGPAAFWCCSGTRATATPAAAASPRAVTSRLSSPARRYAQARARRGRSISTACWAASSRRWGCRRWAVHATRAADGWRRCSRARPTCVEKSRAARPGRVTEAHLEWAAP